jgi:O-acetyl-ADP-ribose deacetylase
MNRIEVIVGDLLDADVEAIVNAANSELWMGGGVAGAIRAAAGEAVEREAVARGPIQPGEAVVTSAGRLRPPIRWIVHAATMGPDLRTSEDYIRLATASALRRAAEAGARSVGLPALGTGVGGFPIERAAEVMTQACHEQATAGEAPDRIVVVVRSEDAASAFRRAAGEPSGASD